MKRFVAVMTALLCLTSCANAYSSSDTAADPILTPAADSSEESTEESESSSSAELPSFYSLDINEPSAPQITNVSLEVYEPTGISRLESVYNRDVLSSGTVGLVGCPVSVELEGKNATLTFTVDPEALGDIPFTNLIVLKSGGGRSFDSIQFKPGKDNTVSCLIDESDTYMLVDAYQWWSCWGGDVSGMEHETEFTVGDNFNFRITLPEGVAPSGVSDYWHDEYNGRHKMMSKQLMHQNQSKDANIKAELYAWRYPNDEDNCDDPAPFMSFDDKVSEISSLTSDRFTVEAAEVWELDGGRKGFAVVFRFPGEPDRGIDEQTNINAYYEYSEDTYILYTISFFGYDQNKIEECIKSAKSFNYIK